MCMRACVCLGLFMRVCLLPRLLVGAPWSGYTPNRMGDVYKCEIRGASSGCQRLGLQSKTVCVCVCVCRPSGTSSAMVTTGLLLLNQIQTTNPRLTEMLQ